MKAKTNTRRILFLGSILIYIIIQAGCEEKPVDDKDPFQQYESAFISSKFNFSDAVAIRGQIPEGPVTADLKIDKSTIYLAEGVKNCISILYPGTEELTGSLSVYLQVKGADTYFDIKPATLQSLDTIGVYCIEFDPDNMELPYTFEVVIVPHDASGNAIDRFEREVVIEKTSGSCDIFGKEGQSTWKWMYTVESGGDVISPTRGYSSRGTTSGCCVEGETVDCVTANVPESQWRTMEYENRVSPLSEMLVLKSDKTMSGSLLVFKSNINYRESDFCGNQPAYSESRTENSFWGEFDYDQSGRKISFRNLASRLTSVYFPELDLWVSQYDEMYIGSHKTYSLAGCHFMAEEYASGEGGGKTIRWFERLDDASVRWSD